MLLNLVIECGRGIVNHVEFKLRTLALREGVELELDIRKGLIICYIYASVSGTEESIRAYQVAVDGDPDLEDND